MRPSAVKLLCVARSEVVKPITSRNWVKNCVLNRHHVSQRKFSGVGAKRHTGAPSRSDGTGQHDERSRSFCALLNDAKRVAAVEQHRSYDGDVVLSNRRRQIVSIAIVHFGLGFQSGVTNSRSSSTVASRSTWAEIPLPISQPGRG